MFLTVLSTLFALLYLLLRQPDPAWFMSGGLILLGLSALPAIYLIHDAKRIRPVTNNRAAVWILIVAVLASEGLLRIPHDMLRVIMSPWPVAIAPLALALWIGYRNDPLKGIF